MWVLAQTADITPWAQFGLSGIVIGALFFYVWRKDNLHSQERNEYRTDIKDISDKHDETVRNMNDKFYDLQTRTLDVLKVKEDSTQGD